MRVSSTTVDTLLIGASSSWRMSSQAVRRRYGTTKFGAGEMGTTVGRSASLGRWKVVRMIASPDDVLPVDDDDVSWRSTDDDALEVVVTTPWLQLVTHVVVDDDDDVDGNGRAQCDVEVDVAGEACGDGRSCMKSDGIEQSSRKTASASRAAMSAPDAR